MDLGDGVLLARLGVHRVEDGTPVGLDEQVVVLDDAVDQRTRRFNRDSPRITLNLTYNDLFSFSDVVPQTLALISSSLASLEVIDSGGNDLKETGHAVVRG